MSRDDRMLLYPCLVPVPGPYGLRYVVVYIVIWVQGDPDCMTEHQFIEEMSGRVGFTSLETAVRIARIIDAKVGGSEYGPVLVEKYKLDISPATVRNEMMALEEEGYIMQPHTSAGRIPTEKAYNLFLTNFKASFISLPLKSKIPSKVSSRESHFNELSKNGSL